MSDLPRFTAAERAAIRAHGARVRRASAALESPVVTARETSRRIRAAVADRETWSATAARPAAEVRPAPAGLATPISGALPALPADWTADAPARALDEVVRALQDAGGAGREALDRALLRTVAWAVATCSRAEFAALIGALRRLGQLLQAAAPGPPSGASAQPQRSDRFQPPLRPRRR